MAQGQDLVDEGMIVRIPSGGPAHIGSVGLLPQVLLAAIAQKRSITGQVQSQLPWASRSGGPPVARLTGSGGHEFP